jgi:hypothetical protein
MTSGRRRRREKDGFATMRMRGLQVLALGGALALAMAAPAQAASVQTTFQSIAPTPSPAWGVFAPCPSAPSENCGAVYAITDVDGTVYIGGSFTELISPDGTQTLPYQNLAALNESTGTPDTSFAAHTFNGAVDALAVSSDGTELYVGGAFTSIDGATTDAGHLAAFDAATGAHLSFGGAASGPVYALLPSGTGLYVGGAFYRVDGKVRHFAAELNASTGAIVWDFAPQIAYSGPTTPCKSRFKCSGSVHTFYLGTDQYGYPTLYLGGEFSTIGGVSHYTIGAVNPTTGAVSPSFDPQVIQDAEAIDWISQIVQDGDEVLAGQAGYLNMLDAFDPTGVMLWNDSISGDVQAIALDGPELYVGGHFNCWCTTGQMPPPNVPDERIHLALVDASTGVLDTTWEPFYMPYVSPDYFGVWALDVTSEGDLWAGGEGTYITSGGSTYPAPKVAVFR